MSTYGLTSRLPRKEVIQPHFDTATLLRLSANYRTYLRQCPPKGWTTDFGYSRLSSLDGRCVQDPGTYSPWHADPRLLAIPRSWSRVADSNPN